MKSTDKKFETIRAKAEKQLSLSAALASEVAKDIIAEYEDLYFYGVDSKGREFIDRIRTKYDVAPLSRPMLLVPVSSEKFQLLSSTPVVDIKLGNLVTLPISIVSEIYVLFYLTSARVPLENKDMRQLLNRVIAVAEIDKQVLEQRFTEWVGQFNLAEQEELAKVLLNPLQPIVTDLLPLRNLHYLAVPRALSDYETPTHKDIKKLIGPQFVIRKRT